MSATVRDKAAYHRQTDERINRHFESPDWSVRQKLALACRILAMEGHDSGLAGQVTARGPKPGTYYMLRFGFGFDEITAANLLLVDDDLNVLEGDGMPNPSNRFHLWIYRARAGVNSIMHTHAPHVSALSMIGVPLLSQSHRKPVLFRGDRGVRGRLLSSTECANAVELEAIGDKKTILLAHHGQLTATASVEHALVLAMFVERAAKLQLMAMSAGTILPVDPALAQEAHDYRHKAKAIAATFDYYARRALREDASVLD
jgi:L-fuculose-phosphate aldolase